MKNTQTGFSTLWGIIILLVIAGGVYWYVNNNKINEPEPELVVEEPALEQEAEPENSPVTDGYENYDQIKNDVVSHCGFVINSHKPNDLVYWPIVIDGTVEQDSTGYNCFWQTFEGVSGTAQLYAYEDNIWRPIGNSVIFGPDFSLNFNFTEAGLKMNSPIKIIFTEENPSVERPSLTFELPLVLK